MTKTLKTSLFKSFLCPKIEIFMLLLVKPMLKRKQLFKQLHASLTPPQQSIYWCYLTPSGLIDMSHPYC
jgi:hypothetical protein